MRILELVKRKFLRHPEDDHYRLFKYTDSEGNFDYEKYKQIQENGNKRKISQSWITEDEIIFLSKVILNRITAPQFGLCHGTRKGLEQKWFSKHLSNIPVLGTEISSTANDFENTIQWDFHDVNPEWNEKADFVYSNSLDHSYDPCKALNAWVLALKPDGICIIEHSRNHTPRAVTELDPFGASLEIMPYLVLRWTNNNYSVREIVSYEKEDKNIGTAHYLVIMKS